MYLYSLLNDVLGPRDIFVGDVVLLLEILQLVVGSDLAELVVFVQQFVNLSLVGSLVDFVGAVEFLDEVHEPEDAVDLFFVLEAGSLLAGELDRILHLWTIYLLNMRRLGFSILSGLFCQKYWNWPKEQYVDQIID